MNPLKMTAWEATSTASYFGCAYVVLSLDFQQQQQSLFISSLSAH